MGLRIGRNLYTSIHDTPGLGDWKRFPRGLPREKASRGPSWLQVMFGAPLAVSRELSDIIEPFSVPGLLGRCI